MNIVRNAEAVFVGTVVLAVLVACAAPFYRGERPTRGEAQAQAQAQPRRVSQLIAVPAVPVVIVRGKRPSHDGQAAAVTNPRDL